MSSLLLSAEDLDFLLFDWLKVERLLDRPRFAAHDRETFCASLDVYRRVAEEHFAPHNRSNDLNEPRMEGDCIVTNPPIADALRVFRELGLMSARLDYADGGMQLPEVIERAGAAWLQAANPSTAVYPYLTIAGAALLRAHGSEAQIARYARPMSEGRWFGTMCLSEPQAGSSLADLGTRAEPRDDGTWRLFGNKMWTSAADHDLSENIVHLVLARLPEAPAGVKGISLFIVPKYLDNADGTLGERNDVVVAGLNHKMGYRGTTNCAFNLGEGAYRPLGEAGAIGHLVGEPHKGLAYMFHMMNEARISVGLGATALGYAGYLHSLDYARTRLQGRVSESGGAGTPQVPIINHPDIKRMLLAQKSYVEGALALNLCCAMLVDEAATAVDPQARADANDILEVLTPVAKSWPSQWCLEANNLAIQIHGGYGYTRDYHVEQFYRDNRLNAIHEGTNGIQAIDLLNRKISGDGGVVFSKFTKVMRQTINSSRKDDNLIADLSALLSDQISLLERTTQDIISRGLRCERLDGASLYLEAFGHIIIAWIWLSQINATYDRVDDFALGKRHAAEYFFRYELPFSTVKLNFLRNSAGFFARAEPQHF